MQEPAWIPPNRRPARNRGREAAHDLFRHSVFRATLFDCNGALVDDEAVYLAAFREVLAPLAVAISDASYLWRKLHD